MKRLFLALPLLCLLLLLTGCGAPAAFNGNRTSDERQFYMEYTLLNMTETRDFALSDGDAVDVSIISESGDLSVLIQKDDDAPVYEGHALPSGTFRVTVHEGGTYRVTVTGKMAKGSVRFSVHRE